MAIKNQSSSEPFNPFSFKKPKPIASDLDQRFTGAHIIEKEFSVDRVFLNIAKELSRLSKCRSLQIAALIVKDGRIISQGINGTPPGFINCDEMFPPKEYDIFDREKHHEWSQKFEIHCELNALLFAAKHGISIDNTTMYITYQPCANCVKNIIAAGIKRVVYENDYDKCDWTDDTRLLFKKTGVEIIKYS